MSDERFEQWLREAAEAYNPPPPTPREEVWAEIDARRAYNRPPATPRDAMWSALQARRAERAAATPVPLHGRRRIRPWVARTLALAAMLVIGIGLGRITLVQEVERDRPTDTVAERPSATPSGDAPMTEPATPSLAAAEDTPSQPRVTSQPRVIERTTPRTLAAAPRVERAGDAAAGTSPERSARRRQGTGAYAVAAQQTLGRAEALLTSFRSESADSATIERNAQIAVWSRDLLSITRLLLDSPAAQDAEMAALLGDLELVLVQMVRLGSGGTEEDAELIREALRQRNVLPRLRTAVPAGQAAIGT